MRLDGPRTVLGSVEDRGDGTYSAAYSTTLAGTYQLHVTNGAADCLSQHMLVFIPVGS